MRTLKYLALMGAALTVASGANAAVTINSSSNLDVPTPTVKVNGNTTTINFGQSPVGSSPFTSSFSFMTDQSYMGNFTGSTSTDGEVFTAASLAGAGLAGGSLTFAGIGTNALSLFNVPLMAKSVYTLSVSGSGTADAAFTGNGSLTPTAAVPEPATWAMMLVGFGGLGLAVRRRRQPVLAQIA